MIRREYIFVSKYYDHIREIGGIYFLLGFELLVENSTKSLNRGNITPFSLIK